MKTSRKRMLLLLLSIMVMILAFPAAASAKTSINKKTATLKVGQTTTLKVLGSSKKATWSSSKKAVATVSKKGVVTAKKSGTAVITAKVGGKKYTCKVTVKKAASSTKTAISEKNLTLYAGETQTLKIVGSSKKASWSSSKKSVATVTNKGLVTAKKGGTATITAKIGNKKYTCKVTVKENAASSSQKWTRADVTRLDGYLIDAMNAVDSAERYSKTQSSYDYYISKASTFLDLAHDLALAREWGGICDNDGITIGANIDGLRFLAEKCKEFKSVDSVIAGRVFYNTPLDAANLNLEIAKTRNAIARYALNHF